MLALLSDDNSYLQTQINTSKQDNLRAATKVIKTIDILEKRIYISWKMEYFKVERVHYSHFIFILSFNGIIKIKIILDANKVRKLTSECKNKKKWQTHNSILFDENRLLFTKKPYTYKNKY